MRVDEIKDLGVIFNNNVIRTSNKVIQVYGFLVRHTRELNDPNYIKQLYMLHARSILEHASVIWNPYYQYYKYLLEKIQNKIVQYMYYEETHMYQFIMSVT